MSPALNESSAIRRFKGNYAIKIRDGITFDFYTGLPHILIQYVLNRTKYYCCIRYKRLPAGFLIDIEYTAHQDGGLFGIVTA